MAQVSRNWCFTLNNYTNEEVADTKELNCKFMSFQEEVGESGTPHLQGYVVFSSSHRLSKVSKLIPRAHWTTMYSTPAKCIDYTTKEDTRLPGTVPFSKGEFPKSKAQIGDEEKARWAAILQDAKDGVLETTNPKVHFLHFNTSTRLAAMYAKPPAIVRTINVFWGPTCTGKSRRAHEEAGPDSYAKDPRSKFWYGYSGEQNVIMYEFRGGIDIAHMLRMTDRYGINVEVKNSSAPLMMVNMWITSNLDPRCWYPEVDPDTRDALLRRLKITHMLGDFPFK